MVEGRTEYRIVIAGSREFVNYPLGEDFIIECIRKLPNFDKDLTEIVSGTARGADKIGEELVEKYGKEKLNEVAKVNFNNTSRILHTMVF